MVGRKRKDKAEEIEGMLVGLPAEEQVKLLLAVIDEIKNGERHIAQRQTIIDRTVKYMKDLGTYKVQYKQAIEIYADMMYQYNFLSREFERSGFKVIVDTERSGGKKSPILVSLENLRKDIGTYSDKLMLNAKSYNADIEKPQEEKSAFAALLERQKK